MLPDDLDSNSELEKIDKQNQENIEKNLQNMSKMGQDIADSQLNNKNDKNTKFEVKQDNIKQETSIKKGENSNDRGLQSKNK